MASGHSYLTPPPSAPVAVRRAGPEEKLPHDYGTTPGGTLFGTTPGGTRIIYTKDALLNLSRSPLSQTPPKGLAHIPGITKVAPSKQDSKPKPKKEEKKPAAAPAKKDEKDDLFDMEM
ncbi:eukaryotic translation initiation factor 4E binding protein 2 [Phlyctochytrium arcticum]|nr:eukaryotic translation initiation factor 4E binding protein 2 [Phlyctochytrium arcticum]